MTSKGLGDYGELKKSGAVRRCDQLYEIGQAANEIAASPVEKARDRTDGV